MYDRILVPTDGSDCAALAVDHALDLAEQYDAELLGLYVVASVPTEAGPTHAAAMDSLEAYGREVLDDVAGRADATGVEFAEQVARGTPHIVIVDYAREEGVDLIVMGTHGRTGIERYLLGSVTEKVVRTADCPVLTVREQEEQEEQEAER